MSNQRKMASGHVIQGVIAVVALLAIVVFLLFKLATSGFDVNAEVMTKEAVASRLKAVGEAKVSDAAPGMRTGEQVYKGICMSCHDAGLAGSPKFGDATAWAPRIAKGYETLVTHAIQGFNAMPAKGGGSDLTDDEVKRAVAYIGNKSGAQFVEPPIGGGAASGAAAALDPDVVGKKIYESVCVACHGSGAAGAPKFADKAAWAKYTAKSEAEIIATAIKGVNAMPPKGGYSGSDEEFKAAVAYMLNAVK